MCARVCACEQGLPSVGPCRWDGNLVSLGSEPAGRGQTAAAADLGGWHLYTGVFLPLRKASLFKFRISSLGEGAGGGRARPSRAECDFLRSACPSCPIGLVLTFAGFCRHGVTFITQLPLSSVCSVGKVLLPASVSIRALECAVVARFV